MRCTYPKLALLTFAVEELAAVLPRKRYALRELAHELDDLGNVIVVFRIS